MTHTFLGRHFLPLAALVTTLVFGTESMMAQQAQLGQPVDILTNGGFEAGTQGWTPDGRHERIDDPRIAHGGKACLSGAVTQPKQALRLLRNIPVRAGNRYVLKIWAKGTPRTKLVVWAKLPGSENRTMLASWLNVARKWRLYRTPISITQSGTLALEIIAPSSHGAPAGRIWIDDIAMYETEMPATLNITRREGFNDEPAMAAAADGSLYVAFNHFVDDADSLQIDRFHRQSGSLVRTDRWQVVGGEHTYILGINAISAGDRVAITYATETKRNWNIHTVLCGPDGPSRPIVVTDSAGVDVKPSAAWHKDTLWVTWESNRNGYREIFVASVYGSTVSNAVPLSRENVSSYDPSITVLANGQVCVAWHAFESNNYDIHLCRSREEGGWDQPIRLTHAPTVDRHVALFCRDNQLWLTYENAQTERYYVTRTNRRHVIVAKVMSDTLVTPRIGTKSVLDGRCEGATAQFDQQGRLWIAMLRPRLPRAGWDVYLTGWANNRWIAPIPLSSAKGMDRTPSLIIQGDQASIAFQADDMPQSWSDVDKMATSKSDIYVAEVDLGTVAGDGEMEFQPLAESKEPFPPATIRLERGEDTPTRSIEYDGKRYQVYYGDLHEHSDVSVCNRVGDQSLDESYQHLRDLARHDFVCITDHGYNLNTYLWNYSAKLARVNDDPQRFLTFLGQEWTSTFEETNHAHPYGFYGHRNLILADLYFPTWWNARNRQKPTEVWDDLRRMKANFVHIPHQLADTGNVPTDWHFHDEVAQPVAEIFQTRGSYEYFGAPRQAKRTVPGPSSFLQDAWARDIVIGVIASPDHGGGYGKACVFAEQLTRESILDALRARRCYGTTAAKIFLDVRINGHLMGEKLASAAGKSVKIDVTVRCPMPISTIEVCRDNTYIDTRSPQGNQATVSFVDQQPPQGRCYYYVRVTQEDDEIAWSSPVWFGAAR